MSRPRSLIEADIRDAQTEIDIARDDIAAAEDWLASLEAELAALPPDGDERDEQWYARHDPRQLALSLP